MLKYWSDVYPTNRIIINWISGGIATRRCQQNLTIEECDKKICYTTLCIVRAYVSVF